MAVTTYDGKWPHTKWIDLKNDGVMVECAVLKEDGFGNIYYVEVPSLDNVDRDRIARMLTAPRSGEIPLWETMSQTQLRNGMNALDYFHQLQLQSSNYFLMGAHRDNRQLNHLEYLSR